MKWFLALVLIAVFAVAAVAGIMSLSGGAPVEAARAERGNVYQFIDERGKTRLPNVHVVTMPFAGRLEQIELEVKDHVSAGQVVARLVQKDLEDEVQEADAVVARLDASIAENKDKKTETLLRKQTEFVYQAMELTVSTASKREEASEKRFRFAEEFLAKVKILFRQGDRSDEEVDRAEVQLKNAEVDWKEDQLSTQTNRALLAATNIMPLLVDRYIIDQEFELAELEKQREEALARLSLVKTRLQRSQMRSPVNGVVLEKLVDNERYLAAGEVLLKIGELDKLEIEADILSQDVVNVRPGQRVEIYGPAVGGGSAQGVTGKVTKTYPAGFTKVSSLGVEEQRVKVIIAFDEAVLEKLRTQRDMGVDFRVRVRIFTDEAQDAIIVPRSALFRGAGGTWQLYVVRGGRARRVNVTVGILNDATAEIVDGVAQGEPVVLAPDATLADGSRVTPLLSD